MKAILNNKSLIYLLLSLPVLPALIGFATGDETAHKVVYPTGEWAARWLILALIIGPLHVIFGPKGWTRWLLDRRRAFGLMAFYIGAIHLVFYAVDKGAMAVIVEEFTGADIWTGWLALLLMLPLALTSNDAAMRAMKAGWKRLHMLAYPAFAATMAHWAMIGDIGALIWTVPVLVFQGWGFVKQRA